jgi:N-acetylmuramoyl-L-alanine amidase
LFVLVGATASYAGPSSVKLFVGDRQATFIVSPFVDGANVVQAPIDFVKLLGADYTTSPDGTASIISAEGVKYTVPYTNYQDRAIVPLIDVANDLGADIDWNDRKKTVTLRAKILMLREDDHHLTIVTSYPVYSSVQSIDSPDRLYVDVMGASLGTAPTTIPVSDTNIIAVRSKQFLPNDVRLVLDLRQALPYHTVTSPQSDRIYVALGAESTPAPSPAQVAVLPPPVPVPAPAAPLAPPAPAPAPVRTIAGVALTSVNCQQVADGSLQIIVHTAGHLAGGPSSFHAFLLDNPNRLALDLPGAALAVNGLPQLSVNDALVRSVRWGIAALASGNVARVVADLSSQVHYTVASVPLPDGSGDQYTITLLGGASAAASPSYTGAPGTLSGKTVIVDPGHGGKDSGAPGLDGTYEKNFTLSIGLQLRDQLTAAGANVILTRSDDTFIPLSDRAQLGVDHNADYFVSIHCDSSGGTDSHEGSTVYYHGNVKSCHDLALNIANRLSQLNDGITSDGVKSDYVRFPMVGFAVLRKSPEPAVLVECGYVNDRHDLTQLMMPDVLKEIASGIVAGLQDFATSHSASNINHATPVQYVR